MKKLLLLFVVGVCTALSGRANPIELVLKQRAGHEIVLALEPGMSVSLGSEERYEGIKIVDANDSTLYDFTYAYGHIASLSYRGDIPWPVGIEGTQAKPEVKYTLTHEGIQLQGLSAKARVMVYAPNGQLLTRVNVANGSCTIQKSALPKGVVLVKINDDVIKIMNR